MDTPALTAMPGIIGRQAGFIPNSTISGLVDFVSTAGTPDLGRVKSYLDGLAKSVGGMLKPFNFTLGGVSNLNDDCFCTVHKEIICTNVLIVKKGVVISSTLEGVGFLGKEIVTTNKRVSFLTFLYIKPPDDKFRH